MRTPILYNKHKVIYRIIHIKYIKRIDLMWSGHAKIFRISSETGASSRLLSKQDPARLAALPGGP